MTRPAWVHLHLPKLRSGDTEMISVKVPGERIWYTPAIALDQPTFKVHQAGRRRCLATGQRNVHAWVVGVPCAGLDTTGMRRAVYDPWKGGTFVDAETFTPVFTAERAVLVGKDLFYRPGVSGRQAAA